MGGFNSSRWHGHRKAPAVENCLVVNLGAILRGRAVAAGVAGTLRWDGPAGAASVGYGVTAGAGGLALRLRYHWSSAAVPGGRDIDLPVRLEPAPLPKGGVRWWGRCPLAVAGVPCGRRVAKLYLPPGSALFGCRTCHGLTYGSRQDHDKRVAALLKDPDALFEQAARSDRLPLPHLGLLLKALYALRARGERLRRRLDRTGGRPPEPNSNPYRGAP